jgi:preprotein translocase subunit SecA
MFKQDPSENTRKKYQDRVDAINALEPKIQAMSDEELRGMTEQFKQRVKRGESLDSLLPEAFAVGTDARGACVARDGRRACMQC